MNNTVTIEIDRLRIYARHGVMPQENTVGNLFEITLRFCYDAPRAIALDDLNGTVNYAEAVAIIAEVMKQPSKLLEHLCGRIRDTIMKRWPMISSGNVKVTKLSPPIPFQMAGVSVSLTW